MSPSPNDCPREEGLLSEWGVKLGNKGMPTGCAVRGEIVPKIKVSQDFRRTMWLEGIGLPNAVVSLVSQAIKVGDPRR